DPSGNGSVFASGLLGLGIGKMTPFGLAFDSSGNLYTVDQLHGRILRFDPQGHVSMFATNSSLFGAEGMAIDGDGNIYVADNDDNSVIKFDTNGVASVFASPVYPVSMDPPIGSAPVALAFDSSGNLYVGNDHSGTIVKFDPSGNSSVFNSGNVLRADIS